MQRITALHTRDDDAFIDENGRPGMGVPEHLIVAEYDQVGCFPQVGRMELSEPLPLEGMTSGGMSLATLTAAADRDAGTMLDTAPTAIAARTYVEGRQTRLSMAYEAFGKRGLDVIGRHYASPLHAAAIRRLISTAGTWRSLAAVDQASIRALLHDPAAFVPCTSLA